MRFEKQNIFFISDLHIFHKNVIKFDGRPFADIDEMHQALIKNWNSVVGQDDIVFYLGDLSFGKPEQSKWFVHQLNGKIFYIMGNHDRFNDIVSLERFEHIYPYGCEIYVKDDAAKELRGSNGYQQIILSHYPILSWNRIHHGSIHLHGHEHQHLTKSKEYDWFYKRKVIDVGCNGIDYTPISYAQVKEIMSKREVAAHH